MGDDDLDLLASGGFALGLVAITAVAVATPPDIITTVVDIVRLLGEDVVLEVKLLFRVLTRQV